MIGHKEKAEMVTVYQDSESEYEREQTVIELAEEYGCLQMEVRQILQDAKVYVAREGKTEKETYAYALHCVTGVDVKEFMKMSLNGQKGLMGIFRGE